MTTYGLTESGFVIPTITVIREQLNTALRAAFGSSIDLGDQSILGQIVGILAERLASLWEKLEQVNSSQDPDKATGAGLDALSTLTGTFRPPASYSVVTLTWTGDPATDVPVGTKAATASTAAEFQTVADVVLAALDAWTALTGYAVDDRVTNAGSTYVCIAAGTSAAAGGPVTTTADEADGAGTLHWRYMGAGTAAGDAVSRASDTGPTVAHSGDITSISTSVAGVSGVINLLDATPGADVGTDAELRVLRELELASAGRSTPAAILAALLAVPGVTSVTVFVNNTDAVDADGMPPHSVEALVRIEDTAANNQLIFDALHANVAAGIATTGTTSGTATDSQGVDHVESFSHPDEVEIWVILNVDVDATLFPADGSDQIKAAVIAWGDAQKAGKNAVASGVSAQAFSIDGVVDVTSCLIGLTNPPTLSATLPITLRQLAVYDTSRIAINIVEVTP